MKARCEVCGGIIARGALARLLVGSVGPSVYGHARCIDALVVTLESLGAKYLGDLPGVA